MPQTQACLVKCVSFVYKQNIPFQLLGDILGILIVIAHFLPYDIILIISWAHPKALQYW